MKKQNEIQYYLKPAECTEDNSTWGINAKTNDSHARINLPITHQI